MIETYETDENWQYQMTNGLTFKAIEDSKDDLQGIWNELDEK